MNECVACGHSNRYHFDDGCGNVVCRFSGGCHCVHRAESVDSRAAEQVREIAAQMSERDDYR